MSNDRNSARPGVPEGYEVERERGAIIVALPSVIEEVAESIRAAGTLYAAAASQPHAEAFIGRGAAYHMRTRDGDWVVRHYRRGGVPGKVLTDEYASVGPPRPLRELQASVEARKRGVDTPQVIAAVVYPAGPLYRGDIATRYVPQSMHLADVTIAAKRPPSDVRNAAWRVAGSLLRVSFAAGVEHADLNMRNILIQFDGDGLNALLLDLDRATVRRKAVSIAAREKMLERLHRSRRKLEAISDNYASEEELAEFEAALRGEIE